MLISVQYARAAAALLVVLEHISGFSIFSSIPIGHFGWIGVNLFFVISGFIMWETSRAQSPANFIRRRAARVVPPYWFYTTLLVVLALVAPACAPNIELSMKALLGSYFFIPYTDHRGLMNPILLQGWTLNLEMYFYIVFAVGLFLANRLARFAAISAFFAIVILTGLFVDSSWAAINRFTSPIVLNFVMGMAVSLVWQRWRISPVAAVALLLTSVAALFCAELLLHNSARGSVILGVPAAFLLLALLNLDSLFAQKPEAWLLATGNASYSLYLAHPFVLSAVHLIFQRRLQGYFGEGSIPLAIAFAATAIAVSLFVSHVSYMLVEKPAARFVLRQLSGNKRATQKHDAATV